MIDNKKRKTIRHTLKYKRLKKLYEKLKRSNLLKVKLFLRSKAKKRIVK